MNVQHKESIYFDLGVGVQVSRHTCPRQKPRETFTVKQKEEEEEGGKRSSEQREKAGRLLSLYLSLLEKALHIEQKLLTRYTTHTDIPTSISSRPSYLESSNHLSIDYR